VTILVTTASPFVAALGQALDGAAPVVRQHLALSARRALHVGSIRRRLGLSLTLRHRFLGRTPATRPSSH